MKFSNKLKSATLFLSAASAAIAAPTIVSAQTEADVIIVTAQKREQDIQDVPIAMTATSGDQLQAANIATVNELPQITPSLFVNTTNGGAADTTIRIRGVGTTGNNPGLEGAVGVFVDGVYRNRAGMALGALDDIQRVEVLRGPQSTLFGRNTSAGALSIITNAPTANLEGFTQFTVGDWDRTDANGWINVPLSDAFATRFSAGLQSRSGFLENRLDGADMNSLENWYLRGQAMWDISPDATLRLIADYNSADTACCGAVRVDSTGAAGPGFMSLINNIEGLVAGIPAEDQTQLGSYSQTTLNQIPENEAQDWGVSAELNWDLTPNVLLTNILAYRDFSSERSFDADYTGVDFFNFDTFDDDYKTVTEELRLSGNWDGALGMSSIDWLAGVFYSREEVDSTQRLEFGDNAALYTCGLAYLLQSMSPAPCFAAVFPTNPYTGAPYNPALVVPGQGSTSVFDSTAESWSLFGQTTFNFTEQFRLTLGLRYIDDHKEATGVTTEDNASALGGNVLPPLIGLVNDYDVEVDDTALTGTINIQYDWTPDIMTYASYSRGYKAGGINLDRTAATLVPPPLGFPGGGTVIGPADPTFDPEFSDNFEVGIKSLFDDGRLGVNFTIFNTEYEDLQVLAFTGFQFLVQNAEGGYSRGAELETVWRPTDNLTLSSGVTYAYTRYDDGVVIGVGSNAFNAGGEHFTNAPVWSATFGAGYEWDISDALGGRIQLDYLYGSGRNTGTQQTEEKYQAGYGLLNARASLVGLNADWDLSLWCRNCTDQEYYTVVFDAPFQSGLLPGQGGNTAGFVGAPREVGLTLSTHW